MKLRDAIEQDFFFLSAAADAAKTPLNGHLLDLDRFVPDDTMTYEQHATLVGSIAAEATGIARDAQADLNAVKAELMKLVDLLGNPDAEVVGYVRLWDKARTGKDRTDIVPLALEVTDTAQKSPTPVRDPGRGR